MGLLNLIKKRNNGQILKNTDPNIIYTPIKGQVIPLEDIGDKVFSDGYLGKGCGINPVEEHIFAPLDGEIVQVTPTKHAIGIRSVNGIDVLIHIGLDTVTMNGAGFKVFVKPGDKVKCGQSLLDFSISEIKKRGLSTTIAVTVANSEEFEAVRLIELGSINCSSPLLEVR